jgi:hypothetical protein
MRSVGLVLKFHSCISFKNSAISSIYSRSYAWNIGAIRICKPCWPSYLSLFYISGYEPPIEVNPIGVVQEFHKFHSDQNLLILVVHTESYARNFVGSRICQHCRHSHLVWFISRVLNLRLRWFQLGWTHNFSPLDLGQIHYLWISFLGATSDLLGGYPLTILTTCSIVPLAMPWLVEFDACMMMLGFMTLFVLVLWSECWCVVDLISAMISVA